MFILLAWSSSSQYAMRCGVLIGFGRVKQWRETFDRDSKRRRVFGIRDMVCGLNLAHGATRPGLLSTLRIILIQKVYELSDLVQSPLYPVRCSSIVHLARATVIFFPWDDGLIYNSMEWQARIHSRFVWYSTKVPGSSFIESNSYLLSPLLGQPRCDGSRVPLPKC